MQTGIAVHDTDQKQGNVMNITPNHDNSHEEKQMNVVTRTTSVAVLVTLGLALMASAAEPPKAEARKVNYGRPFETPTRAALIPLPAGAVEPQGWLRDWCVTARDGYTGHIDERKDSRGKDLVKNPFRDGWAADYRMTGDNLSDYGKGSWAYEAGGYWFDGLVRLGYGLHDDFLIDKAKRRLGAVVDNMNDKGISFFWWLNRNDPADVKAVEARHVGTSDWPMWANGLFGRTLAAYCAASSDPKAIRALELAYSGNREWTRSGWGLVNPWPACEAYTWTGNAEIKAALMEMFTKPSLLRRNMYHLGQFLQMPREGKALCGVHVVCFYESTSPWALGYLWTGDRSMYNAPVAWHEAVRGEAMQPHGVLAGDYLNVHAGAFVQTETCNVAAHIWNHLLLLIVGGEGVMADRIERAFFNAAPATVNREFTWNSYHQTPNRITPSLPGQTRYGQGAFCCGASVNRMVPYYLTHMWMATYDNGLVATHYGPCRLSARAGDGVPVAIDCRTNYPFDDAIDMTVKPAKEVVFPLSLRIPGWCKQPLIAINGTAVPATPDAKGFVRIERTWKSGDAMRIRFPMTIQMETGLDKSGDQPAPYATISYGPLLMALPIADTKDVNTPDLTVKWNYALIAGDEKAEGEMTVTRTPMPAKWDWPLASPLVIRVPAVAFDWKPTWGKKKGERQALPPVAVAAGPKEIVTLVPYGCTKFRVCMFPVFQSKALP